MKPVCSDCNVPLETDEYGYDELVCPDCGKAGEKCKACGSQNIETDDIGHGVMINRCDDCMMQWTPANRLNVPSHNSDSMHEGFGKFMTEIVSAEKSKQRIDETVERPQKTMNKLFRHPAQERTRYRKQQG